MTAPGQPRGTAGAMRQRGVSLIEVMVALGLGLVVVLAASMVFIGSRQANRTTEGLSRAQETARSAFELIASCGKPVATPATPHFWSPTC